MDGGTLFDLDAQPGSAKKTDGASLPPLIVDNFAGGGGASSGIESALGRSPDIAINHNPAALALHAANHPETKHLITSVYRVHPKDQVAPGQRVGLAWFSPDCKHFSKAKGGQPLNKNIRDLAWVVVHWAEQVRPEVIALENVEEFITWGPLRQRHEGARKSTVTNLTADMWDNAPEEVKGRPVFNDDGTPFMESDPLRKGQTFNEWVRALRRLGYKVEWRELRACDYGAPTIRKRLFVIARCDGKPITWPEPTHGDPQSEAVKSGALQPWRTAAECIDWEIPCPSIFDTKAQIKEKHGLTAVRPLAKATQARVARGMKRYVLDADKPFIVNLTHGARIEDATEPFRTITGANRGEKAAVQPFVVRTDMASAASRNGVHSPTSPLNTITSANAFAAVSPVLTYAQHGGAVRDMTDPHHTICANSKDQNAVITPTLLSVAHGYSGGRREYPMTDPIGTASAGGIQHAVAAPVLTHLYGSNTAGGQGDVRRPLKTVTAGGQHHGILAPHVMTMRNSGKPFNGADEPTHTVTAGGAGLTLVAPALVQTGYGERDGQAPRSLDIGAPLGTVVAGGVKHASVAAFLAQHHTARNGVNPGTDARRPLSTIAAAGSHQMPIAAWFAKYYGTANGACTDDPLHSVTAKDRFGHMQAELSAPPFTADHVDRAREVAEFLRSHDAWDGGEFVTLEIDGQTFVVVDIGMRMLTPRELFRAQGFPEDYVIEGVWNVDTDGEWHWKPFTKNVQVSACGNSVCPPVADAIIRENCQHLAISAEEVA